MTRPFDLTTEEGYQEMSAFLARMEAESGNELPDINTAGGPSPRQRARRLLDHIDGATPDDWHALEWIATR